MDQRSFLRILEPMIRPLKQRIMMTIARGILESVKDDGGIQLVKVSLLKDEVRDNIERVQNFGFTSNPPKDSEVVAVFVGGNREHGFVIACDSRSKRIKGLDPGESAQYTDDLETGSVIKLKKGGKMKLSGGPDGSTDLIQLLEDMNTYLSTEPVIVKKALFAALKAKLLAMKVT